MTRRPHPKGFDRAGYEREMAAFCEVLRGPDASIPTTEADLAELGRLVARYPDHARRLLARLDSRPAAASP